MRQAAAAALLGLALTSAHAIDPGTAKGSLQIGTERIALPHVLAVQRDNSEGLLDWPNELRLAITDRPLKPEQLWGVVGLPVTATAMEGGVRGVLLRWNPADPKGFVMTVLAKPGEPGQSLPNTTISRSGGALPGVKIGDNRVSGKVEAQEPGERAARFSAEFSAPLMHEPKPTQDLKDAAARSSPQMKTLNAAQAALGKGDWAGMKALSTTAGAAQIDAMLAQFGPQAAEFAKRGAEEMRKDLAGVKRVVVRGDRAIVLMGQGSWRQLSRDGERWMLD